MCKNRVVRFLYWSFCCGRRQFPITHNWCVFLTPPQTTRAAVAGVNKAGTVFENTQKKPNHPSAQSTWKELCLCDVDNKNIFVMKHDVVHVCQCIYFCIGIYSMITPQFSETRPPHSLTRSAHFFRTWCNYFNSTFMLLPSNVNKLASKRDLVDINWHR